MVSRFKAFFAVLLACCSLAVFAQKTYTVANTEQFIKAVGSDRIIVMKAGTYTIGASNAVKNQNVVWEEAGDSWQLVIKGVSNLTIKASGDVGIVGASPYAYVLTFRDCKKIRLEMLIIGHEATEGCMAGVVFLDSCSGVAIEACDIYGSGSIGLDVESSSDISVANTRIHDCTSSAFRIYDTSEFYADSCVIDSNAAYPVVYIELSDYISFTNSQFYGNSGSEILLIESEEGDYESIEFSYNSVYDNEVESFSGNDWLPTSLSENSFTSNGFVVPPFAVEYEGDGDEYYDSAPEFVTYWHDASGLIFTYPQYWDLNESDDLSMVGFTESESESGILLFTAYKLPSGANIKQNAKKYFDEALKGFVEAMKTKAKALVTVKQVATIFDVEGLPALDCRGSGIYNKKDKLFIWVRFVIAQGQVLAIVGVSPDETLLGVETDISWIIDSATMESGGE